MAKRAMWHLVAGPTGAGKTTVARELAARCGGVVFSLDEWMANLFWMDCPKKNDLAFALERIARCEDQIAATATELANAGVSCVLDLGFTQREHRAAWLGRAEAAGMDVALQVVDVSPEVRWQRVMKRNEGTSGTYSFEVTREMFDFMEARWEPVTEEEARDFRDKLS